MRVSSVYSGDLTFLNDFTGFVDSHSEPEQKRTSVINVDIFGAHGQRMVQIDEKNAFRQPVEWKPTTDCIGSEINQRENGVYGPIR